MEALAGFWEVLRGLEHAVSKVPVCRMPVTSATDALPQANDEWLPLE